MFVRLQRPQVDPGVIKVPVLLNFSPYHNTPLDEWDSQAYVDNGYAAAVADVPGTGNSGGCWDAAGPPEQDERRATNTIFTANGRRSALIVPVEGGEPALAAALGSD